jgi:formylglycine-generating enzyme required for sulfatase activity
MPKRRRHQLRTGAMLLTVTILVAMLGGGVACAPTSVPQLAAGPVQVRDKDEVEMVFVPAGEFLMGSHDNRGRMYDDEKPQHKVYLDAFWIDKTEVTNAQYKKCVAAGKCQSSNYADDARFNGDAQPVVGVSWNDAKTYCEWAGARLPTEAEWEKAARGTDGRLYPWGNGPDTCEYAVTNDGSGDGCGQGGKAWPVGSKPRGASPYGALDMAGNVLEWVADWYDGSYYARSPGRNPTGPDSGESKVLRGGSWLGHIRSDRRNEDHPDTTLSTLYGFRCARSE